ncbi:hypothetical protein BX600DRAFT_478106 [Xylariales sp. PMI_506]|nr:hypothetical protein BX600DRAFT_478106 [Xylariales sp. PMI_506]
MARITIAQVFPPGNTPELLLKILQNHDELMDMGSLTKERHPIAAPPEAPLEEHHGSWQWYSITERFRLPRDVGSGEFSSKVGFLDLPSGMISHVYSSFGVEVRDSWAIHQTSSSPNGEPIFSLTVDSETMCKFPLKAFVKRKVRQSRQGFVTRILEQAQSALGSIPGEQKFGRADPTNELYYTCFAMQPAPSWFVDDNQNFWATNSGTAEPEGHQQQLKISELDSPQHPQSPHGFAGS